MAAASSPARPSAPLVVWHSVRPFSLPVSVVPVLVGTAALLPDRATLPLVALACLGIAVLLQAGTNTLNDAEDALTGADDVATALPSLALRSGWIGIGQARIIAAACFAVAAAGGVGLALAVGRPLLLLLGAAGLLVGWAYTAPPFRLAYRPLGELASGLPMGMGIAVGTAAAQSGSVPRSVVWASIPLALLTAAVLHANNGRDRAHDTLIGKRTLATYLSPSGVVTEFRLLTGLVPVVIAAGLLTHGLPWACALGLLPGLLAIRTAVAARSGLDPMGWTRLLIQCVQLDLLTGLTLSVGFVVTRLV